MTGNMFYQYQAEISFLSYGISFSGTVFPLIFDYQSIDPSLKIRRLL